MSLDPTATRTSPMTPRERARLVARRRAHTAHLWQGPIIAAAIMLADYMRHTPLVRDSLSHYPAIGWAAWVLVTLLSLVQWRHHRMELHDDFNDAMEVSPSFFESVSVRLLMMLVCVVAISAGYPGGSSRMQDGDATSPWARIAAEGGLGTLIGFFLWFSSRAHIETLGADIDAGLAEERVAMLEQITIAYFTDSSRVVASGETYRVQREYLKHTGLTESDEPYAVRLRYAAQSREVLRLERVPTAN